MSQPKIAFFGNQENIVDKVYGENQLERIKSLGDVYPTIITHKNFLDHVALLADTEYIFSTWGMPRLDNAEIAKLPSLKTVFYGAGSVKYFAEPFLDNGIKVISAWAANAIPVAEFTVAQMSLAAKGFFKDSRQLRAQKTRAWKQSTAAGNYDINVSLLGMGMVGLEVLKRLQGYNYNILVFDPFLKEEKAISMGVKKVSLEEAFSNSSIISNHLANVPETQKMLKGELFELMQQNSVFINTGRGATVDETAMIAVLKRRQDITALLDVTDPEPPTEDSELYTLPNVWLSPHIAGSMGREVLRMADLVIEEFSRELRGEPFRYEVTLENLPAMA